MTTDEIQRHFQGILRFSMEYIKENKFTAGNLMELMVYVEELMSPHDYRVQAMVEDMIKSNPPFEVDEQLLYEHNKRKYEDYHDDYKHQGWVYGWLNEALYGLRQQEHMAVETPKPEDMTMRDRVEDFFDFLTRHNGRDNPHILSEPDFQSLVKWVTYYCEHDFTLPEIARPIYRVNTTKGIIIHSFKDFFKHEYPTYNFPDSLYELIKVCFYQYRDDKIESMKKTKEPEFYRKLQKV